MAAALFIHIERKKENPLEYVVLAFISVALLLAVVALNEEGQLRLTLQDNLSQTLRIKKEDIVMSYGPRIFQPS